MATITSTPTTLSVTFSAGEKVAGLLRDISVPRTAIASVTVEPDGVEAARGLRAPGLGLPGRKVGTWRRRADGRSVRTAVSVRRHQPAVRIELRGATWDQLLIGHPHAERVAADLAATQAPTMHEHDVHIDADGVTLVGSLCLPVDRDPCPAVLILTGSGPLDRDGSHPRLRLDVSRQLAHALADHGIASLRYDKRGVGASPGDWREAGLVDLIADARTARGVLAAQPGVDASRVFVLGHSEGALVAGAVAAGDPGLAGVVLLSAAARDGESVLVWQAERVRETLPAVPRAVVRLLRIDLVEKVKGNHRKLKATTTDVARINGARINARWFREYMAYDPVQDLRRITAPVLAITGEKDLQVSSADLDVIRENVPGDVTVERVPDLTHTLRRQPGPPALKLYRREVRQPVDAAVVRSITGWVARHADALSPDPAS